MNGDWIPDCCAGYGDEQSPELYIEGIPAETISLAIVMADIAIGDQNHHSIGSIDIDLPFTH